MKSFTFGIDSMILYNDPRPITALMIQEYYHKYKTIPAISFMNGLISIDLLKEFIDLEKTDNAIVFAIKLYSIVYPYRTFGNSVDKKHYTVWCSSNIILDHINEEIKSLLNEYNFTKNSRD